MPTKNFKASALSFAALLCLLSTAQACDECSEAEDDTPPAKAEASAPRRNQLGLVQVQGAAPTSLPTHIPTTLEGIKRADIERSINATDAEDALKYLPSLLVRKRYIGDYNHAVLSTRASGTGNSARSLVFADGIQLSNLLGNGATFTPRWGLVTPEEIERVDVLYGPFSAAYSGNAVGAVVDYQTRMPKAFEAHVRLNLAKQPNDLYGKKRDFDVQQLSASIGDRSGALSWWLNVNQLHSIGQPLTFPTKLVSAGAAPGSGAISVTGAVLDKNRSNVPWYLIGTGTEYDTTQNHAKLKLAYDISSSLRASYVLGTWGNASDGSSRSYLRDGSGNVVDNRYGGDVSQAVLIDGKRYTLAASDFTRSRDDLGHSMQALSLKSRTGGAFDYELAASTYDYGTDLSRAYAPTTKAQAEAGRITDQNGTGWTTLSAKGVYRLDQHSLDFGLSQENYELSTLVNATNDWRNGGVAAFTSRFGGKTSTDALFVQDAIQLGRDWQSVLGLRAEHWTARDGLTESAYTGTADRGVCSISTQRCALVHPERSANYLSPKAALSHQLSEDWVIKASTGRAIRFPTVSELYQGGVNAAGQAINNNPELKPERSWTSELSAEWAQGAGAKASSLRVTLFREDSRDALYSQLNVASNANTVQNVRQIRTHGVEVSYNTAGGWTEQLLKGLSLLGSVTFADSRILANDGYVALPGDTLGKQQPRVPRWRATLLASWQALPDLALSLGARYSGPQFSTLDNSDPNGFAYQAASKYFTTDLRAQWKLNKQFMLSAGVDNLNNYQFWNFHPYPQRTWHAEIRFDL
ncbi:TonB-dependent receptor [Pelomonas sp. SE-A7]|uniref:TonB-dependent receptor n=1 Tax=Pelomonas sp. SE-A7 TaxID=3054953 RepID=UPI00259CFE10|nr:TonB-dependent receptor [Pelomonas sp. SE-A7]MDM4766211.1 TonB-dependent receptor [Pelomonas sp. SE-A7]